MADAGCRFRFRFSLGLRLAWPMDGWRRNRDARANVDGWAECIELHQMERRTRHSRVSQAVQVCCRDPAGVGRLGQANEE